MGGKEGLYCNGRYGGSGGGMFGEKRAFILALNEVVRSNPETAPQLVYRADPERNIVKVKMLIISKLKQLRLKDLAKRIRKRSTRKLIDWLKEWQAFKRTQYERLLEVYKQTRK